jgi:hypothetical protein
MAVISLVSSTYVLAQEIRVNQDEAHINRDQNEPTIAYNPNNPLQLVAGSNYFSPDHMNSRTAYYRSTDGGWTWSEGILPKGGNYDKAADPSVAFDSGGNVYFAHLSIDDPPSGDFARDNGIFVNRSTNGGQSWMASPFVVWQNGNGDGTQERTTRGDRPQITCDLAYGSPYPDRVYVVWVHGTEVGDDEIRCSWYNYEIGHFSSPVTIGYGDFIQAPSCAVGPGGIVYVTWFNGDDNTIKLNKSTNGGVSFGTASTIVSGIGFLSEVKHVIRATNYPSIAVDNSGLTHHGKVYVAWTDKRYGDPDVLYAVGTPTTNGGLNWSAPSRIHPVSTKDQFFPWVAVSPTGVLGVIYYDCADDPAGVLTKPKLSFSADGGLTFPPAHTLTLTSNGFDPKDGSDPYSSPGFFGDYIGLAMTETHAYSIWTDTRNGGDQDVFFTYPEITFLRELEIRQKKDDGVTDIGTIGRWRYGSFIPRLAPGVIINAVASTNEVFGGDTAVYSSEKYNRWFWNIDVNDPDRKIFHPIGVATDISQVTSRYKRAVGGIQVQSKLVDAPATVGGIVQFRDPWYIDTTDAGYGNTRRNRGMGDAVWYNRTSPLFPDFTNSFPQGKYNGIFLDEGGPPNWFPPYYGLGALDAQPIGAFTGKFLGWRVHPDSAVVQDSMALQTGIVFKKDNTAVIARYKAVFGTSTATGTGPNSQRKMIRDGAGRYHLVYESAGEIWYARSTRRGD